MPVAPYYLTAAQAADALSITRETLYAYTSRGQLRSEAVPGKSRERRYFREDVERLRDRKEARRDPARAAARGLHWGGPVLDSGVTLIHNGKVYYRGHDAIELAKSATLEEVASLLWEADEPRRNRLFNQPAVMSARQLALIGRRANTSLTALQAALPVAGGADFAAGDLSANAVRRTGARIIRMFTTLLVGHDSRKPVHLRLQASWAPKNGALADVIRTALVLCADHELNVSAFTARCAASAGASPYDVVSAAMATFKGHKHGGASERVLALFSETPTPRAARTAVATRLRRGERLPGFGHPLYPSGDPRALLLLQLAEASGYGRRLRHVRNLLKAGSDLLSDFPNLDFGLAAVTRAYGLANDAPAVLFALGRTVGWIAHAIEEYASGRIIRPRARYTGPTPSHE